MDKSKFDELVRLIERSIYHSELKEGYVISGIHLNVPVNGNMTHMINLDRRLICESVRDARMEEDSSARILAHQLAYIIEHEDRLEKPVYQESEDGRQVEIGQAIILLDRKRLSFPIFVETTTEVYLDCSGE